MNIQNDYDFLNTLVLWTSSARLNDQKWEYSNGSKTQIKSKLYSIKSTYSNENLEKKAKEKAQNIVKKLAIYILDINEETFKSDRNKYAKMTGMWIHPSEREKQVVGYKVIVDAKPFIAVINKKEIHEEIHDMIKSHLDSIKELFAEGSTSPDIARIGKTDNYTIKSSYWGGGIHTTETFMSANKLLCKFAEERFIRALGNFNSVYYDLEKSQLKLETSRKSLEKTEEQISSKKQELDNLNTNGEIKRDVVKSYILTKSISKPEDII